VDWIDLVQHKDKWQAVVSSAMHSRVPLNAGNFLTNSINNQLDATITIY
jgi:hypothetical protein